MQRERKHQRSVIAMAFAKQIQKKILHVPERYMPDGVS
jgi:hypothetical protein